MAHRRKNGENAIKSRVEEGRDTDGCKEIYLFIYISAYFKGVIWEAEMMLGYQTKISPRIMFLDLEKIIKLINIYIKWFKMDPFIDQRYWQVTQQETA